MIAKLEDKNTYHFAHKSGDDSCCSETYLHRLGKLLLRKKIDEFSTFKIKYLHDIRCKQQSSCIFCATQSVMQAYEVFDLKKYYNICAKEQKVFDYRADLLLSDSTGKYERLCIEKNNENITKQF
ncbi:hypothetical protein [Bacteroides sp.]|uniref:hypothetical protein n=1 Tax=Bacteroides sp. TaxID=29523 RepID=UPI0026096A81|nr:hypothetical protein [Bacteroides sp.]MDD3040207.1 hypothetical protein [Bacteroides sp.]